MTDSTSPEAQSPKRAYSAPTLVVIDVANRTTTGAVGALNDGTNAITASVAGS